MKNYILKFKFLIIFLLKKMTSENENKNIPLINKTLFFTSIKDNLFDYSLPIKTGLNKFCNKPRAEASPSLFEYLCYKIVQKNISKKNVNKEVAIISEKFLSSKNCKINIMKTKSIKKKYILIPIRNEISRKWNAVIFVHLEKQIMQYMNQMNEEPIIAKIISSNINSEEDDYILNTTMDRIETAFNFTSPEDIQFEVDSINISDQPNTSVFLLNFIEGLINQENNDNIMNYIMKLYDETSNSNAGNNNYFISFNKENKIFNELNGEYQNELEDFLKIKEKKEKEMKNNNNFNNSNNEEEIIDSEEEALRIIAKENEEIRKQMEEQDLCYPNRMNNPNYKLENVDFNNNMNMLGLIQEVDNESDDDSEKKNNLNNNSLKISKTFKIIENNNNSSYDIIKNDNKKKEEIVNINKNNIKEINKDESIELNNNIITSNDNVDEINKIDDININNKEKKIDNMDGLDNNKNEVDIKSETNILSKENNREENNKKYNSIKEDEEKENEDRNNIDKINITEPNQKSNEIDDNNSFERISILNSMNKTIDISNNLQKNKNYIIENNNYNSVRDSCNSNNSNNSIYERKKLSNYNINKKLKNKNNSEDNLDKYNNYNIYISKNKGKDNILINNKNNYKVNIINELGFQNNINNANNINYGVDKYINNVNDNNTINRQEKKNNEKNNENNISNIYKNKNIKNGKYKVNLPLVKKNIVNKSKNLNDTNNINLNNNDNINNNIKNNKAKENNEKNNKLYTNNNNKLIENNLNDNVNKLKNNEYKKIKKNTIIINETSNNSTVINFIEIKNNYEPNSKNNYNNKENKENDDNITTNKNQIWNINISNNNNFNLISDKDDNDFFTHIPDDGTVNRISTTLNPHRTIAGINNKENLLKIETEENDKINEEKINILTNINNISDNKDDEENKIDVNHLINSNRSKIQRKTTKSIIKREKNKRNIGFIKDFEPDDCALNLTKDLKCGCTGTIDNTCFVF